MENRLWIEKHRPKKLEHLDYNENLTKTLKKIS